MKWISAVAVKASTQANKKAKMANLKDSCRFKNHNDYYTPAVAWKALDALIPKDKVVWEACMLGATKSKSPAYLEALGCKVVFNTEWDILKEDHGDIIITNPPFENKLKVAILKRLVELDKPFIIIMNSLNVYSNYFRDILDTKYTQIITPRGKINFDKLEDGELKATKACSFYSVFVAYKMNLKCEDLILK